ncbi:MAG: serpin family protein [Staphylococcus sp.]|nr:serpin family protein [Staphylococcus sp.]
MKHFSNLFLFLTSVFILTSCSSDSDDSGSNERKDINLNPTELEIVKANTSIGLNMLSYFDGNSEEDNFMVSPLSAQFVMGMLANGAQGKTLDEITAAMGTNSIDELNDLCKRLLTELPKADKKTTLRSANSAWFNKGYNVLPSYSKAIADYYRAGTSSLDLTKQESIMKINNWCSSNTDGLINSVITEPYDVNIRLVLLNAIYFKGEWKCPFSADQTVKKDFNNADGSVVKTPTMCQSLYSPYYKHPDFELLRLSYGNYAYAMTIILPSKDGSLSKALASLDGAAWAEWKSHSTVPEVKLEFPKFKIETKTEINKYLQSLGIKEVYCSDADLSAMADEAVSLSTVDQYTSIEVDEKGTVASVVSKGEVWYEEYLPTSSVDFHIDRPFAFVIEETSTGSILFVGRVNKL